MMSPVGYKRALAAGQVARSAKSQCPYFEGNPGLLVGVVRGCGGFSLGPAAIAGIGQEATWISR